MSKVKSMTIFKGLSILVILATLISACAQPTQVVEPTEPPPPTEAPAEPTEEAEEPSEPEPEPGPAEKPTIVALIAGDYGTLDPHAIISRRPDRATLVNVFDSLVWLDRDGIPGPEIAESWEMVDPTTWEFKLVEGATFHNGEPINAEAVQYSLLRPTFHEELMAVSTVYPSVPITDVEIIDEYTVRVLLESPVNPPQT